MSWIAIGLTAATTAVGAIGRRKAGKAEQRANYYNAALDENQAKITRLETIERIRRLVKEGDEMIGAQRTQQGASGFTANSGSALILEAKTAERLELAKLELLREGNNQALALRTGAESKRFSGAAANSASKYKAGSTLIQGFGQGYDIYRTYG